MRVVLNRLAVRERADLILEHFFMDAKVRIRVCVADT